MRAVIEEYGLSINRSGYCNCPFHNERTPSMKIYKDSYYCFGCGEHGDIFTFIQLMDNLSFQETFARLGGTNIDTFTAFVKSRQAKAKRENEKRLELITNQKLKRLNLEITAYRNIVQESEPLSDIWTYAYNKLQYRIYVLEEMG